MGKISVLSGLGQPLRVEVELSASGEELSAISARIASSQAFKQAGVEYVSALAGIRAVVDKRSGGKPVIRLTTEKPVNDPFMDLLLEINWSSGRLVREYTFLLDPPPEMSAARPSAPPVVKREQTAAAAPAPAPKDSEPRAAAPAEEKPAQPKAEEATASPAPAPAPVAEAATREIKRGDNLRKIAAETKPEGVSLDQMLVAIFRSNKDAFAGNNMHRLKVGKILTIPDREAAAGVGERESRKVIAAHTADFNAYRKKLSESVAAAEAPKETAAQQEAAGKITAKVEEKVPAPVESKDQLKVSKSESAKEMRAAQGKIAALEEDLIAKDKALKEAQSRQADLERNVNDLKKLLDAKNQSLAELEKQAAAKVPTPEPKKAEPPVVAVAPVAVPEPPKAAEKPVEPAPAAEAKPSEAKPAEAKPAEEPKLAEAAKAEEAKPAEAPKPPPAPKKAPPPPPPEPSLVDELLENPAILGGGVLVLGLLGLVAYRQRQKRKQEAEPAPTTSANLATNSVFGATGGQSVDTTASSMATDFSQASISAIDAEEGVDPVAEADVYMAYGRDAQAEEILLDALKTDPTRTAIHVKLLEIYAARKNTKQFETLASDLYAQTGGVGADWEKAAAMGQKLDASNPLYGGGATSADSQTVSTDTTIIVPPAGKMRDTWTMPGELGQIAAAVEGGDATVILDSAQVAAAEAAPLPGGGLDFDLDLGSPAPATMPAPAEKAAAPALPEALDFDLGLDEKPAPAPAAAFNPDATMIIDSGKAAGAPADLRMDLSLGEQAASGRPAEEPLHFDLDLGLATTTTPASEVVDLERTLAGLNVRDLANERPAAAPAVPPALDIGEISLDLNEPEAAGGDEVVTKLELAKAYEEMGDKEGARELLQEVVKEGNAEQREKAQSLLGRLG